MDGPFARWIPIVRADLQRELRRFNWRKNDCPLRHTGDEAFATRSPSSRQMAASGKWARPPSCSPRRLFHPPGVRQGPRARHARAPPGRWFDRRRAGTP